MIEYLPWDSNFFNLRVGKINFITNESFSFNSDDISNYDLLYLFTKPNQTKVINHIKSVNGVLVDEKVTFSKEIKSSNQIYNIEEYNHEVITDELYALAIQSGIKSRFKIDSKFPKGSFEKLYKEWIEQSVINNYCDKIFVVKDEDIVIGFVTLHLNGNIGKIGLIAVNESYRGKGIGKQLMYACENYLYKNKIKTLEVITQKKNSSAMHFYSSIGYSIMTTENIYHLWRK